MGSYLGVFGSKRWVFEALRCLCALQVQKSSEEGNQTIITGWLRAFLPYFGGGAKRVSPATHLFFSYVHPPSSRRQLTSWRLARPPVGIHMVTDGGDRYTVFGGECLPL